MHELCLWTHGKPSLSSSSGSSCSDGSGGSSSSSGGGGGSGICTEDMRTFEKTFFQSFCKIFLSSFSLIS